MDIECTESVYRQVAANRFNVNTDTGKTLAMIQGSMNTDGLFHGELFWTETKMDCAGEFSLSAILGIEKPAEPAKPPLPKSVLKKESRKLHESVNDNPPQNELDKEIENDG